MQKTAIGGRMVLAACVFPHAGGYARLRLPVQMLRIMRMIFLFLFTAFLSAHATGSAQTVTLSGKDISLRQVFHAIEKQTGYVVFSRQQDVFLDRTLSLTVYNMPLRDLLDEVLKELPVKYAVRGKTIFLTEKDVFLQILSAAIPVRGQITDPDGRPVPSASVRLKGSASGTFTDAEGNFSLDMKDGDILEISSLGFAPVALRLSGREFRLLAPENPEEQGQLMNAASASMVLRMIRLNSKLDEVQIVAYGTSTRRFNVGSVSSISAEEIRRQPVSNVLLALQGQVPGLFVNATSGAPGTPVKLQVRGQNSLSGSVDGNKPYDQPLFVIDGVPFAPQNDNVAQFQSLSGLYIGGATGGMTAFNSLNPADIESISVLKDADATSIYGSQAANGVVLITTKKGAAGKTKFSLNINTAFNKATRQIQLLNTQQYLEIRREALANDGIALPDVYMGQYGDLLLYDSTKYTNWFHELFGGTAGNTDVYGSLSGGTGNTTFIVSAGFNRSTFNFPGGFADNRFTFHSGFNHTSRDRRFMLALGADISYDRNNNSGQPAVSSLTSLTPNFPDMLDENGKLVWNYKGMDLTGYQQYSYLFQPYDMKKYYLNNHLQLAYNIMDGLRMTLNLGYSRVNTNEHSRKPKSSQSPSYIYASSSALFGKGEFETVNIEPQLTYERHFGKGTLSLLAGATYKSNQNRSHEIVADTYPNDALLGSTAGAENIYASISGSPYKYAAGFGRINYIHDRKYILNLTGRRDGSSNFGPGRQFGNFGSVGAGWLFTEENFFGNDAFFISYGKLAANYGTNGSDGAAPYKFQPFWSSDQYNAGFQGIRPYTPLNLYNPDYSWALKRSWNASLDLGMLNDRLLLNATWYRNRMGNQLTGYSLPGQTGFNSVLANFNATIQNTGWEFSLNSVNIRMKDFSWTTNFNISFNDNKLIAFPNLESTPYANIYALGRSTSVVYGYRYKGVNEQTGIFEFYSAKGEATSKPDYRTLKQGGDWQVIGDFQQKCFGGLGNTFTWKGISLTAFFQFAVQNARSYMQAVYQSNSPGSEGNMPVQVTTRWQKPGDRTNFQKLTSTWWGDVTSAANAFINSSGTIADASYVRLKTLSAAYTLPDAWLKRMSMERLRVFINAQNLLTLTKYEVGDPEIPGMLSIIPLQRTVDFGLSFEF